MAVIHRTTLTPSKLDLLATWLPAQSWYVGTGHEPRLGKAGGFRLDDPRGEVGIEFMAVTDESGDRPRTYHVPFSYRAAPLDGGDHALIGTTEHGVLGRRWVYDGTHDPVLVAQLLALVLGQAAPQAQSESHTPDPSVANYCAETGCSASISRLDVTDGPHGTDLLLHAVPARRLTLRVNRLLEPDPVDSSARPTPPLLGHVTADWLLPDGTKARGRYAVLHDTASD